MENFNENFLILDEFDIIQNNLLGAHAFREFVKYYEMYSAGDSPDLILFFPLLPILFNNHFTTQISKKHFHETSLIIVKIENAVLFSNLQERMEKMTNQTFSSLNVAFSLNLLRYNSAEAKIELGIKTNPSFSLAKNYSEIILASKRLGAWFGQLSTSEILKTLEIKFI
jgi:hypothetical protein